MTRSSISKTGITCPISHEYTKDIARAPCGHEFDTSHILEWINRSSTGAAPCPLCRREVSFENLTYVKNSEIRVIAEQFFLFLRSGAREAGVYLNELVKDFTSRREYAYGTIVVSLIPKVIVAGFLANGAAGEGNDLVALSSYRSLSEDVTGAMASTTTVFATELYRGEMTSDPGLHSIVRKVYKFTLDVSRMAIVMGNPLMAVSNLGESSGLRPIGATLIMGGTAVSQTAVIAHSVKKDWQLRKSTDDFVGKLMKKMLYLSCLFLVIYNFAISIFND